MSREHIYRGKRIDNGEWVEGDLIRSYPFVDGSIKTFIGYLDMDDIDSDVMDADVAEVDPSTVGEYTGLSDKNGKKIFEGDILKVHDEIPLFDGYNSEEICYNGKVMYIDNQGMYVCEGNGNGNALCALNLDKCEVIGNIHDNPELLEVSE